ncbi:GTP-binding protein LepA [Kribbella sp. NPDC026611]|uniref:GTP-binding protein LepA n=1 Tax=Kribbella sp. NPDC026611 TaxID=3154911 RepID=UPI003405B43B
MSLTEVTAPRRFRRKSRAPREDSKLTDHVDRLGEEHPPIRLDSVDYTIKDPRAFAEQFGPVVAYMTRVELEVERNVLELNLLLPDAPEVDRHFYNDVWMPQETHHGLILDKLQQEAGLDASQPNLDDIDLSLKILGALGKIPGVQDISRMLYYLTGLATERSAVLAYNRLHSGLLHLGERAIARTVVAPIRRQEPGHFAYYQLAANQLWDQLSSWQKWLTRALRKRTFEVVGAYNKRQVADLGDVLYQLDIRGQEALREHARQIGRAELELMFAHRRGLRVPDYVFKAFRRAAELAAARKGDDRARS